MLHKHLHRELVSASLQPQDLRGDEALGGMGDGKGVCGLGRAGVPERELVRACPSWA